MKSFRKDRILTLLHALNFTWPLLANCSHLTQFVTSVLQDETFQNCEIVFTFIEQISENKHNVTIKTPYISIQSDDLLKTSSGVFVLSSTVDAQIVTHGTLLSQRLHDIHKYNPRQCAVGLVYFSKFEKTLPKWLFTQLTPLYVPIIRKDEDHFIFITENENVADSMLLSSEFGNKIKFKISLYSTKTSSIALKTVQLYTDPAGIASVSTSIIETSKPINISSLYQDTTQNLHQRKFRVANLRSQAYFVMMPDPRGRTYGMIPIRGLYKIWLDEMQQRYNFTSHVFLAS